MTYFNRQKGYGFVLPFGRNDQVFVRSEDIESDRRVLSEGQHVSFSLALGAGRWEARRVKV
ncbi:cold-shock protein [Streptomyces candidus]|uniref:CspA family cold shock protein n=1 Tax=Streptomyces candidus TaxID=67283 RepID=A0A7X0HLS2_9ACTN|nr:cold shock domain-containing protein [Streptomyces candidus]MBB6440035.1 CspA family cold shock protein [Streptomyces candidus]